MAAVHLGCARLKLNLATDGTWPKDLYLRVDPYLPTIRDGMRRGYKIPSERVGSKATLWMSEILEKRGWTKASQAGTEPVVPGYASRAEVVLDKNDKGDNGSTTVKTTTSDSNTTEKPPQNQKTEVRGNER